MTTLYLPGRANTSFVLPPLSTVANVVGFLWDVYYRQLHIHSNMYIILRMAGHAIIQLMLELMNHPKLLNVPMLSICAYPGFMKTLPK